jgi:hypothetical protein
MMGHGSEIRDLLLSDVYVGLVPVSDLFLRAVIRAWNPG